MLFLHYMKFEYWVIGKTKEKYFEKAEAEYLKRLGRYTKLDYRVFPEAKAGKNESAVIKSKEATTILDQIQGSDYLILLDENGKQYSSIKFAEKISKYQLLSKKRVIFLTGGAYGFDKQVYDRSNEKLSLSDMTFSHQMVRTFFLEQFYRAFTIINNEKYHNP